jgi:type II secretory pathway pseudopilin PulG
MYSIRLIVVIVAAIVFPSAYQIYRKAQVDTLRQLQQQTEKAIATTVEAKLKIAEESEGRELEAVTATALKLARAPMTPVKCTVERTACIECYR